MSTSFEEVDAVAVGDDDLGNGGMTSADAEFINGFGEPDELPGNNNTGDVDRSRQNESNDGGNQNDAAGKVSQLESELATLKAQYKSLQGMQHTRNAEQQATVIARLEQRLSEAESRLNQEPEKVATSANDLLDDEGKILLGDTAKHIDRIVEQRIAQALGKFNGDVDKKFDGLSKIAKANQDLPLLEVMEANREIVDSDDFQEKFTKVTNPDTGMTPREVYDHLYSTKGVAAAKRFLTKQIDEFKPANGAPNGGQRKPATVPKAGTGRGEATQQQTKQQAGSAEQVKSLQRELNDLRTKPPTDANISHRAKLAGQIARLSQES